MPRCLSHAAFCARLPPRYPLLLSYRDADAPATCHYAMSPLRSATAQKSLPEYVRHLHHADRHRFSARYYVPHACHHAEHCLHIAILLRYFCCLFLLIFRLADIFAISPPDIAITRHYDGHCPLMSFLDISRCRHITPFSPPLIFTFRFHVTPQPEHTARSYLMIR